MDRKSGWLNWSGSVVLYSGIKMQMCEQSVVEMARTWFVEWKLC